MRPNFWVEHNAKYLDISAYVQNRLYVLNVKTNAARGCLQGG